MSKNAEQNRVESFLGHLKSVEEIRNLTPHDVSVVSGIIATIYEKSLEPLRISESIDLIGQYTTGVEVVSKSFTDIKLPEENHSVLYIVSLPVAQLVSRKYSSRVDFVTPGELIRDDSGNIVGCKNLAFIV